MFSAGASAGFEEAPFFLATAISFVSLAVREETAGEREKEREREAQHGRWKGTGGDKGRETRTKEGFILRLAQTSQESAH